MKKVMLFQGSYLSFISKSKIYFDNVAQLKFLNLSLALVFAGIYVLFAVCYSVVDYIIHHLREIFNIFRNKYVAFMVFLIMFYLLYTANVAQAFVATKIKIENANIKEKKIVIAVIDTGVDVHHSFIKNDLWVNPGESGLDQFGRDKSSNGIDDDQDGLVDDIHGWNFIENKSDLNDRNGHGTHISGIILERIKESHHSQLSTILEKRKLSQASEKSFLSSGQVQLMILKYYSEKKSPKDNMLALYNCIDYAISHGAQIINFSSGGYEPDHRELELLKKAAQKNILVISAAGNDKVNTDQALYYPAGYGLSNIFSVGAVDEDLFPTEFTNFGRKVDLMAPGYKIVSTLPKNKWGELSGTSQSTAFVSGILAKLLLSGEIKIGQTKSQIIQVLRKNLKSIKVHNLTQYALVDNF